MVVGDEGGSIPLVERSGVVCLAHGIEDQVASHHVEPRKPIVEVHRISRTVEAPTNTHMRKHRQLRRPDARVE